jgi:hypothetical protein
MSSTSKITDTGRKGDLRILFGFERFEGVPQAHMFIHAAHSPRQMAAVPLKLMYLFDERDRVGPMKEPQCLPHVTRLAEAIYGAAPSRTEVYRVLDAVTELKNMPPPSTWRDPDTVERLLAHRGYDMVR